MMSTTQRPPEHRSNWPGIVSAFANIAAAYLLFGCCFGNAVADESISFNRDVRPILSKNCFACHGQAEDTREADLRLDVANDGANDGANDDVLVPEKPDDSELWRRIVSGDPDEVMPPPDSGKTITAAQREIIRRWIEQGAKYERHWSFVTPEKPAMPDGPNGVGKLGFDNPIDAFLQRRLHEEGLAPAPVASKESLIRRVTLDLTGLPPTPKEVDEFLADDSAAAYERLVDRLQQRVTYGEHMARYWLDLARYADTHGLHLDNERSMWPYRDWVVRAINQNLPFDEFTRWQLAGDLLDSPTREQQIASGFNRCNVTTGEGGSIKEEWIYRYAVERTSTTSEVWMGLTAGCAVCHDHKFDPLSTKEYYSMYAFFHSAADPAMDGNKRDTPPILKLPTQDDEQRLAELKTKIADAEAVIQKRINEIAFEEPAGEDAQSPDHSWVAWKKQDEKQRNAIFPGDLKKKLKGRSPSEWTQAENQQALRTWLRAKHVGTVEALKPHEEQKKTLVKEKTDREGAIPLTFVMADLKQPRKSFVMLRGAYDKPGEPVTRSTPAFLPPLPDSGSGDDYNRLDLANWLLSEEHPLTTRVTVNRFWQQFFGTGLVETSEDFGTQGQPPSHPALLDWLATQFREDGWDMKLLVKRIVTSHAYRQSSKASPELLKRDPANRLLARGPRLRLDAEVLRDQALFVSGLLVSRVGGKGVNPYQPPNIWEPVGFGSSNTRYYKQGKGDDLYRRSIYTFLKRTAPAPFMSTFDAPNREQSCSRRGRSNTPMQALQLMNDIQHVEAARNFAQRIIGMSEDDDQRIVFAWRSVTSRRPDTEELALVRETLKVHRQRYQRDTDAAATLTGYGESTVDQAIPSHELAAWTMIGNLLLNLDETICKN